MPPKKQPSKLAPQGSALNPPPSARVYRHSVAVPAAPPSESIPSLWTPGAAPTEAFPEWTDPTALRASGAVNGNVEAGVEGFNALKLFLIVLCDSFGALGDCGRAVRRRFSAGQAAAPAGGHRQEGRDHVEEAEPVLASYRRHAGRPRHAAAPDAGAESGQEGAYCCEERRSGAAQEAYSS
jgi:hypothetical protein